MMNVPDTKAHWYMGFTNSLHDSLKSFWYWFTLKNKLIGFRQDISKLIFRTKFCVTTGIYPTWLFSGLMKVGSRIFLHIIQDPKLAFTATYLLLARHIHDSLRTSAPSKIGYKSRGHMDIGCLQSSLIDFISSQSGSEWSFIAAT